jgi:hypothetical protein
MAHAKDKLEYLKQREKELEAELIADGYRCLNKYGKK